MTVTSDRHVTPRSILRALTELQRQGTRRAMEHLEQTEPDLAEFVIEWLSLSHQELLGLGGPAKRTRNAYRRVEALVLVSLQALRQSHFELWRELASGTRLGEIDPSLAATGGDPGSSEATWREGGAIKGAEDEPGAGTKPPPF
jgi:hypothetical protein